MSKDAPDTDPEQDATHRREDKYIVHLEYFIDGDRRTMRLDDWALQPEDAAQQAAALVPDHADFDPDENLTVCEAEPSEVEMIVEKDGYDMTVTLELADDVDRAIAESLSLKLWFFPEEQKVAIRKDQVEQFSDPALWYTLTTHLESLGYDVDWDQSWTQDDADILDDFDEDDDN